MRGDLRVSTKYIDWALVPSRWIERRFLIFTVLRSPGYILLHLVAGPPLAAVVGITVGVLLELVGVPDGNGIWAFVLGALLVASLMGYRLLSFTVFNASGVHIFRFIGCWWWQTDIPWVAFRETARVNLDRGLRTSNGLTPPDTHNLALHLKTMEEWAGFVEAGGWFRAIALFRWRASHSRTVWRWPRPLKRSTTPGRAFPPRVRRVGREFVP